MPDSGVELPSGFLTTFGRPARESACECERTSGLQLGPVMALVSGPTLGRRDRRPGQRADQARHPRERRRQADRRALPPDPQPAGDARGDRDLPRRPAVRSTTTTASSPRTWASARSSSPSSARSSSATRWPRSPSAQAALAAYEKELAPRLAQKEKEKAASDRQARGRPEGLRGDRSRPRSWPTGRRPRPARSYRWAVLEPKSLKATGGATLDQAARRLDRRRRARTPTSRSTRSPPRPT